VSSEEALYGVRDGDVREVADLLAGRLGCSFAARESDYFGEYFLAHTERGDVKIVAQPDPEGEPLEDEFEEYQVLVYSPGGEGDLDLRDIPVGQGVIERLG
jgi:hypothetical protein